MSRGRYPADRSRALTQVAAAVIGSAAAAQPGPPVPLAERIIADGPFVAGDVQPEWMNFATAAAFNELRHDLIALRSWRPVLDAAREYHRLNGDVDAHNELMEAVEAVEALERAERRERAAP